MLQDYKRYLTNIRNSLIQCGVELSVSPLETYRDLFFVGFQLDEVLWYYSILAISGSEHALKGFFLPLNNYYKGKMRHMFYEEFSEYVKTYRKLSTMYNFLNSEGSTLEPEIAELDEDEVVDLFSDEGDFIESSNNLVESEENISDTGCEDFSSMVNYTKVDSGTEGTAQASASREVESELLDVDDAGSWLDNLLSEYDKDVNFSELAESSSIPSNMYTDHGIYIEDLDFSDENNVETSIMGTTLYEYQDHGIYLEDLVLGDEEVSSSSEYQDHGIYIEDLAFEDGEEGDDSEQISYDEDGFEIEEHTNNEFLNEISEYDNEEVEYDDDGFEIVEENEDIPYEESEDDIQYDEDGFEIIEEESSLYDEEEYEEAEDGNIQYDEDGFEISEDDDSIPLDDEGGYADDIQYDENGFEINDDEENIPLEDEEYDDGVRYDENGFEIEDDEESNVPYDEEEYEEPINPNGVDTGEVEEQSLEPTKDISDYIQDITNDLLTKGKRLIYNEIRKL